MELITIKRDKNYNHLTKLDQMIYDAEFNICDNCKGYENCQQTNKGMMPVVIKHKYSIDNGYYLASRVCNKRPGIVYGSYERAVKNSIPLYETDNRKSILNELFKCKGGFLYGNAGVGKSTIMLNLANEFRLKGIDVYFELANNISVSLKEFNNNEAKMQLLQNVDVLFIDDFAREVMTNWVILNIFNPIIQHRIDNGLPIYISCNYSLAELFKIIETKSDYVSADAIISRLKTIGTYNLKDKNYRLEK